MAFTAQFEKALTFATRLHASQTRKGTEIPYVAHLLGVSSIAIDYGATEEEAIAALLHDAVEDQGGQRTLRRIHRRFGPAVADIVLGCSDTDVVPKPPWRERKEAYITHLLTAPPSVRLVSASDKLHNARAIVADYRVVDEQLWERFTGGKEGTLWYYRELVTTFRDSGTVPALVAELDLTVSEMERLTATAVARGEAGG
jgi:(p)ppGpp synthase/HD superfamily hydrolase